MGRFLSEDPVTIAELAETRLVMAPLPRLVLKIEVDVMGGDHVHNQINETCRQQYYSYDHGVFEVGILNKT